MSRMYYRIEVVSELLEMPRAQLKRYERLGLIAPSGEPEHERAHGEIQPAAGHRAHLCLHDEQPQGSERFE